MKKKGLIVSTIVMVLVLAASITTATYAWFTTTDSTTIEGFNISVAPGSAVVVGVAKNNGYDAGADDSAFVSGQLTWDSTSTNNKWISDTPGLGTSLDFNVTLGTAGKVSNAVGWSSAAAVADATIGNTNYYTGTGTAVAANLNAGEGGGLTNKVAAVANATTGAGGENPANGDYMHFLMGVQAAKELQPGSLKMAITISSSDKTTVGNAAAMHVAYKVGADAWKDVDVYKQSAADLQVGVAAATATDYHYNTLLTTIPTYTVQGASKAAGSQTVYIQLNEDPAVINQIEVIIYLAGADSDCIDAAKGATARVTIDFLSADVAV